MSKGVYEDTFQLYYNDFDQNGNVRLSSVLHFLSDVAGMAYESLGFSRDWMMERNQVFLLSQFRLDFMQNFPQNQVIRIKTWENGNKGAVFTRYFSITKQDGTVLMRSSSTWLLADPVSHKILRPKELVADVFPVVLGEELPLPQKFHLAKERLQFAAERQIRYTDMDQNHHVYNAKYADMIYDILPQQYADHLPQRFEIQYKKEAVSGETLQMEYQEIEDGIVVAGLFSDGEISFVAKLMTKEVKTQ